MACWHVLLVTVFLLYTSDTNGIKVVKQIQQSCTVLTDQGIVNLTTVSRTAREEEAA